MALPLLGRREAQVPSVQDAAPIATTPTATMFYMESSAGKDLTARFDAVTAWVISTRPATYNQCVFDYRVYLDTGVAGTLRAMGEENYPRPMSVPDPFTTKVREHYGDAFDTLFLGQGEDGSRCYIRVDHIAGWSKQPQGGPMVHVRGQHDLPRLTKASLEHLAATLIVKP